MEIMLLGQVGAVTPSVTMGEHVSKCNDGLRNNL